MLAEDRVPIAGRIVPSRLRLLALVPVAALAFAVMAFADAPLEARICLVVFLAMMAAWTILDLPQTPVALSGAVALYLFGVVDEDDLFQPLGSDIIWLMLAAFLIAAVVARTGIAERVSMHALARFGTVTSLFWGATVVIALTAFVVPSTSARAAVLLPVFKALAVAIDRPGVTRALSLLFPSVILLSACMALTGAGAHLVAVEFIDEAADRDIGFAEWVAFGAPFGLVTSFIACGLILRLFLGPDERAAAIAAPAGPGLVAKDAPVILVVLAVVILWATEGVHGLGLSVVALAGALVAATKPVSGIAFKQALKGVEWDLLLFLAAALCVGEALIESGAAGYLVSLVFDAFGRSLGVSPWALFGFASLAAALSHLVVVSRTARATVLIPTLALPLAAFGADPVALILTMVLGSGFCQTFLVSAKPVMLFGGGEAPPFSQADLMRLAVFLLPPFVALLTVTAVLVWPWMGLLG